MIPGLPKLPFLLVGGAVLVIAQRLPKQDDEVAGDPRGGGAPRSPRRTVPGQPGVHRPRHAGRAARARARLRPDRPRRRQRPVATCWTGCAPCGASSPSSSASSSRWCAPATTSTCRRRTYAIRLHGVEVARGEAPAGMLLAIGDDLGSLPGTVDHGAGLRPGRQVGAGRDAPARRADRRHGGGPLLGGHHPPGRGRAQPRRPAARPRGRQDPHRHGQGHPPGRRRGADPGAADPGRDPALPAVAARPSGCASATWCGSSRPCRRGPAPASTPTASSRPPAARSARRSRPTTPSTGGCRCSPSTRCWSRRCWSRCAPVTPAASSCSTRCTPSGWPWRPPASPSRSSRPATTPCSSAPSRCACRSGAWSSRPRRACPSCPTPSSAASSTIVPVGVVNVVHAPAA